jgi:type IV pilus assembly protein PilM
LSKVKIDYAIISSDVEKKKMKVLLVAAPLELIEFYMRVINQAGLNPIALETEILSVTRSVTYSLPTVSNAVVLSFGASNIEIALLHQKKLVLTKAFPVGGNTITRALAEELGFETMQAEEYKKTYGMDEVKLEGKIAKIISPLLSVIFTDIEKSIVYFKEQYPTEDVTTIAITGGSAKLPGLVSHITKYFGLDCQLFNPLTNLYVDPSIASILNPDAPYYTAAIGLALKEI